MAESFDAGVAPTVSGEGVSAEVVPGEVLSPALATDGRLGRAFELKFRLPLDAAEAVEAWARRHLVPDVHGSAGRYPVTTVYCDTPTFDVFRRSPGYRRSKFRLRRYGDAPTVFLERKAKKGDRVRKRRVEVAPDQLSWLAVADAPADWAGRWFRDRLQRRGLRPTCQVAYERTAFVGGTADSPVRLTLDRQLIGAPADDWAVPLLDRGEPLLPDGALLELKFHVAMPALFHDLLGLIPGQTGWGSKYRHCVARCGLAPTFDPPTDLPARDAG